MTQPARQAALDDLRRLSPEIQSAVLLGADGEILALSATRGAADAIAPIMATLSGLASRAAQELGRGAFRTVVVEGAQGLVVGQDLGDGSVVAAVASRPARPGLLIDDVRACAARLAPGA